MYFLKMRWRNAFSYGDYYSEIQFDDKEGIIFIKGINKDDGTSNGSGKSSIIDIFVWTLFGKPLKDLPIDGIKCNQSRGFTHASLEFIINDNHYQIDRYRKHQQKYGNGVAITINGGDETVYALSKEANKRIESIIGLDYAAFVSSLIFSSEVNFDFPRMNPEKRRAYLEQIMQLKSYSEFGKIAASNTRALRKNLGYKDISLEEKKSFLVKEKEDYVKYKSMHEGFDEEKEVEIKTLKKELRDLEKELDECDPTLRERVEYKEKGLRKFIEDEVERLHEIKLELQKIEAEIDKSKNKKKSISEEKNKQLKILGQEFDRKVGKINERLNLIKHECPTCERGWEPESVEEETAVLKDRELLLYAVLNEATDNLEIEYEHKINKLETDLEGLDSSYESLSIDLNKLRVAIEKDKSNLIDLIGQKKSLPSKDYIDSLINKKENLVKQIEEKRNETSPYKEVIANLSNKLTEMLGSISTIKAEKATIEDDLQYASFWDDSFNNDGLKTFIFESIVPVLNTRISHYLSMLFSGRDIQIEFDKYMNMKITKDGKIISYGATSKGERKKIDLTISLALLETSQLQHGVVSNVMWFDEILDSSLDSASIRIVVEILYQLPITNKFLVSHRSEIADDFDELIIVEKINELSRIIEK